MTRLAEKLKNKLMRPQDLPPVRVVEVEGKYYALDHRRLLAARIAKTKVNIELVKKSDIDYTLKLRLLQAKDADDGNYIINRNTEKLH